MIILMYFAFYIKYNKYLSRNYGIKFHFVFCSSQSQRGKNNHFFKRKTYIITRFFWIRIYFYDLLVGTRCVYGGANKKKINRPFAALAKTFECSFLSPLPINNSKMTNRFKNPITATRTH